MTTEARFKSAVNVIRGLPEDGPYQPSQELKLKLYGLYKQATDGPCREEKPAFYELVKGYKWRAWKSNANMSKLDAMEKYVDELKQIVETMSLNADVESFVDSVGPFYEFVRQKETNTEKKTGKPPNGIHKEKFEVVQGNTTKPLSSSSEDDDPEASAGTNSYNGLHTSSDESPPGDLRVSNVDTDTEDEYSEPAETLETMAKEFQQHDNAAQSQVVQTTNKKIVDPNTAAPKAHRQGGGDAGISDSRRRIMSPENDGTSSRGFTTPQEQVISRGLVRSGSGSGGRRGPGDSHRPRGLPDEVSSQLIFILSRIHEDLQGILTRLDTLEAQSVTNRPTACTTCKHQAEDDSSVKRWWPFPELSPRSTFFLLTWPLILRGVLKLFVLLRSRRRRFQQ